MSIAGQAIPPATGSISGEMAGTPRNIVTHIEVRRVQNGFVVMAMDFGQYGPYREYNDPKRACFVCNTPEELGATIASLATMAEMQWLPSVDLPLVDMVRHSRMDGIEKQLQGILEAISPKKEAEGTFGKLGR